MTDILGCMHRRGRREQRLSHVYSRLPALRVEVSPESLPFFIASEIQKLWDCPESLGDVLFDLDPEQVSSIWEESLLFLTFLAQVEVSHAFYSTLSKKLFSNRAQSPCYRESDMPYSEIQSLELGLSPAKAARWEEQHAFTPAVILFNSQEQWLQQIPNRLTPVPCVGSVQAQLHGSYGVVQFFQTTQEYVVDGGSTHPQGRVTNEGVQSELEDPREPPVVAVKSFYTREAGLMGAKNMQLLKQGLAGSSQSISLHNAILERGQGPRSDILIISPRAELGDLAQFLQGGSRHEDTVVDVDHVSAMLQQCAGLAEALNFLHGGFRVGEKLWRGAHMDLKPSNIIIFRGDGLLGSWKLCDFGISVFKEVDMAGPFDGDSSAVGSVLDYYTQKPMHTRARRGAGQYQSPEVHDSWDAASCDSSCWYIYDGRSVDIWSFGCIWAEILAFALGGPRYVHEFRVMRRQKTSGVIDDYFYSPCLARTRVADERFILRPQVHEWLEKYCRPGLDSPVWARCWAAHLINILRVDPRRRPSAQRLEQYVRHVCEDTLECQQEPGPACMHFQAPELNGGAQEHNSAGTLHSRYLVGHG